MRRRARLHRWLAACAGALALLAPQTRANELPEYRLKAAFVYNFIAFTEWPAEAPPTLALCIVGADPFGADIDGLAGKVAQGRTIVVQRKAANETLRGCQVVFISGAVIEQLPRLLEGLRGQSVLTVADSPGAMRRGVALNMTVAQGKVTFEANLQAARAHSLALSSKLLRLATEVVQ
jgi:YfiR/HmsC-like